MEDAVFRTSIYLQNFGENCTHASRLTAVNSYLRLPDAISNPEAEIIRVVRISVSHLHLEGNSGRWVVNTID